MEANVRSLTASRPEAPPPSICNVTSHPICLALTASTLRRTHARAPLICDDPDLDLDPTRPRSRRRGANESGQGCGLRDEVSCSSKTSHDACSCCGHDATAQRPEMSLYRRYQRCDSCACKGLFTRAARCCAALVKHKKRFYQRSAAMRSMCERPMKKGSRHN